MLSFKEFMIAEGDVVTGKFGVANDKKNTNHYIDKEVAAFPGAEKKKATSAMRNLRAAMEKNPAPSTHQDKMIRMQQLERMINSQHTSSEDKKWAEGQLEKLEATAIKAAGSRVTY